MARWFRFYDEALNDPKVQRLSGDLYKAWVNLLCLASISDGVIRSRSDAAFALRVAESKVGAIVAELASHGLLDPVTDGYFAPHNWALRQFKSDVTDPTAAERMRNYRNKNRNAAVTQPVTETATDRNASVSVTVPRADTEQNRTESEKKETDSRSVAVATRPGRDENFEELRKVYPKREGSNPKEPARKLFVAAVKAGTDPQAIIAGARSYAAAERERLGTPFIAQLMTWLRQRRWEDYATTGPPGGEIPAHLRPPPGMPSLEELRAKDREKLNGAAKGTEVRSGPGLGENRSDRPAEL